MLLSAGKIKKKFHIVSIIKNNYDKKKIRKSSLGYI